MSCTWWGRSASRSSSRSAIFELILTVRCQYQGGRSAKFELILTMRCQYFEGIASASRSRGRSAKFELILTMRCQYQGVDLKPDLGLHLWNLKSSWPQDVSTGGDRSVSRYRYRSAKFELILATRCQCWWHWSASLSRGRSAKFELILTMRCQCWGWLISQLI